MYVIARVVMQQNLAFHCNLFCPFCEQSEISLLQNYGNCEKSLLSHVQADLIAIKDWY